MKKPGSDSPMCQAQTVAVVIANWNGAEFIRQCLDAVFSQTRPADEVVLIDNGSTDGSVALIRTHYPAVRLIERPANEGFSRGYNLGISQTRSGYILILNTDVFLDRDFLCRALRAIRQAPDVGSVAAKIYRAGSDLIDNVGQYLQPWLKVANSRNSTQPEFVFSGSGAALFCRRAMLDDVAENGAFFDEAFFLFWEDTDLAWRAQLRGWRCAFAPDAIAHHVGSASQGGKVRTLEKPAFIQRHIWKNRYLIVIKNASAPEFILLLPWLLIGELWHWAIIALRIPNRLPLFVRAHLDAIALLPRIWRQRRIIQRRRRMSVWAMMRFFRF